MHELDNPHGGREQVLGPADQLLIVTGRKIIQDQGYTRLYTVCDPKGNWFFYLTGLGLKQAEYPIGNTNIYKLYPPLGSHTPELDTRVEEIKSIMRGKPLEAVYDPSLTDNQHFAESF